MTCPSHALRSALIAGTAIVAVAAASPAHAQERSRRFDIPAQPAAEALNLWARQAGAQIVFPYDVVQSRRTPAVRGELTPRAALARLTAPLGLEVASEANGIVTLRGGNAPTGEIEAAGAAADSESALAAGQATPDILVVGRRTLNTDIRRTENDAQPYVVLSRQELETSQAANLEDFFRTRLPMNTSQRSNAQFGSVLGNTSSINLRGLGANQTLILVDGRRLPGIGNLRGSGDILQPDINGIPISAVERIEVLPSTASGIYGGGATGGVINIILRRDYAGVDLSARYGQSFRGDAQDYRIEGSAGFSLARGRIQIRLAGSYADADPLEVGDRNLTQAGRNLLFANDPAAILDNAFQLTGFTTNIRSVDGSNLVLDNGTPLGSPRTFVPVGYQGPATDGGTALVANAGRFNLSLPDDFTGRRAILFAGPTIYSASANVRAGLGDRAEIYGDASIYNNRSDSVGGFIGHVNLQANDANNPFTTQIRIIYPVPGVEADIFSESETIRIATGVIARLGRGWTAGADYSWGQSRFFSGQRSPIFNANLTNALRLGPLAPLRDLNQVPESFTPFLLSPDNLVIGPFETVLNDVSVRASGPLLSLPAGPAIVSGFLQYRNEQAKNGLADQQSIAGVTSAIFYPSRSQDVQSGYLEARVPLFSERNARAGLRLLELQASLRHDRYQTQSSPAFTSFTIASRDAPLPLAPRTTTVVQSTDFTIGLRYSPFPDLILRASYGTGFLPPSVAQIAANSFPNSSIQAIDPLRSNTLALFGPLTVISGGNPDLQPEQSRSLSLGLVLTPRVLPDLRVSVDYTNIRKTNEIRTLTANDILANEASLPGRVVRGPRLPTDPAGWAGPIISFNQSLVNIARSEVNAFDFQFAYDWSLGSLGRLKFDAVVTWQPTLRQQVTELTPVINVAGFANGPLEWRGVASLAWERGPLLVSWSAQYYDSYAVYSGGAAQAVIDPAVRQQGSARIRSQVYNDLFVRLRLGGVGLVRGLPESELFGGIQNLFDARPPILATSGSTGGYSPYGDPRLRRFTVGIRTRF